MKPGIVLAALFVSFLLCVGCGSSSSSAPHSSITNGNWSFTGTSTVTSGLVLSIGGGLAQSGNVVSGTMLVSASNANCQSLFTSGIPVTGTFSGDTLTLTSANFSNQIVTVNAAGSGNSLTGTYSVAGGCADGDKGTIAASYLPPITGTWTGTFMNPDGTVIPIDPNNPREGVETARLTLTQSATATDGYFPLSGTFETSFSCLGSGTIFGAGNAYVMGTSVVIRGAGVGELIYDALLVEAPVGSANGPMIGGVAPLSANSCRTTALLNLTRLP